MVQKERVIIAEIYKEDGMIGLDIPNEYDCPNYELLGFLKCYVKKLESVLTEGLSGDE